MRPPLFSRLALATCVGALLVTTVTFTSAQAASRPKTTSASVTYGINTYAPEKCETPKQWTTMATHQVAAFKALGANAMGVVFPIYTLGEHSNAVFAKTRCGTNFQSPSPAYLSVLVRLARQSGLRVFERPVLDQKVLYTANRNFWHGNIRPANVAAWFANYWTTLRPYLAAAQSSGATSFGISGELTSMARYPEWPTLIKKAHAVFKGQLVFTASWISSGNLERYPGTILGIDAYRPALHTSNASTPAKLLRAWNQQLATNPVPGISTVAIDEVGIPAITNAYSEPYDGQSSPLLGERFDQQIQANWFTMACNFVKQHHMTGIYFWGPVLQDGDGRLLTQPNAKQTGNLQPATQLAIRACFARG